MYYARYRRYRGLLSQHLSAEIRASGYWALLGVQVRGGGSGSIFFFFSHSIQLTPKQQSAEPRLSFLCWVSPADRRATGHYSACRYGEGGSGTVSGQILYPCIMLDIEDIGVPSEALSAGCRLRIGGLLGAARGAGKGYCL